MVTLNATVTSTFARRARGFSLVELAVVLLIVGLLLGGAMLPLSAQRELRLAADTQRQLEEAREALLGFVLTKGRLPCPDTDDDGFENQAAPCTNVEGHLPHVDLGIARADPYGWRLHYRVASDYAKQPPDEKPTLIDANTEGDIFVATRGDNPATAGTVESKFQRKLADKIPAVVWSVGANGHGGVNADSGASGSAADAASDEALNLAGTTKIVRPATPASDACSDTAEGSPPCAFDDLLIWLSPHIVYNRMVAAGRLP